MAKRPLTAREASTIEYYCNPASKTANNWNQSYLRANYSKCKNWEANAKRVHDKDVVKAGINAYIAKNVAKMEHNREIAIKQLTEARDLAIKQGNTTSMIAATRELNAISNLHKATIVTTHTPDQPTGKELEALEDAAREYKVRLAQ